MKANKSNYYAYNKNLKQIANQLRKNMTKAEACLWKYALRGRQMRGYQFNRQRPVLSYIADFMCKELNLVIEVDGITHESDEIIEKDRLKKTELEKAGFEVIRFADDEILKNIEGVVEEIEKVIEEREKLLPLPPPKGDKH